MKISSVLALVIALFVAVPSARAQGFYVGVEVGEGRADLGMGDRLVGQLGALTGTSKDEKDDTYGAYFGYAFTKHFAIELSYANLGETRYTELRDTPPVPLLPVVPTPPFVGGVVLVPERQDTMIESEALSLSLIGRYPITERMFFIGRAGIAAHASKSDLRVWLHGSEVRVFGGDSEQSSGAALVGAGLEWDFHSHWHARLQIQQHFALEDEEFTPNVARGDVTIYTAGVGYRF